VARKKVCAWIPLDLYQALVAVAATKSKKLRGSLQEAVEEALRRYVEEGARE